MTNELLPFNLEEALKNPERVVYRNGKKPLEWRFFEKANEVSFCIISLDDKGGFETHTVNGFFHEDGDWYKYDLMLLPLPEKRYWVNVYHNGKFGEGLCCSHVVFDSEDSAKFCIDSTQPFIKTITFTI